MKDRAPAGAPIAQRAVDELREFLAIAAYLYICFTALAYMKAAILQAEGVAFAPFGFAAVKALICAKFMSVGHALRLGERYKHSALIWPTIYKSLIFLVLLIVLNGLEEIIVGAFRHRSIAASLADLGGGTVHQVIATSIIVLLILIPFFAFRSLGEVVGERNLIRIFLGPSHRHGMTEQSKGG